MPRARLVPYSGIDSFGEAILVSMLVAGSEYGVG